MSDSRVKASFQLFRARTRVWVRNVRSHFHNPVFVVIMALLLMCVSITFAYETSFYDKVLAYMALVYVVFSAGADGYDDDDSGDDGDDDTNYAVLA